MLTIFKYRPFLNRNNEPSRPISLVGKNLFSCLSVILNLMSVYVIQQLRDDFELKHESMFNIFFSSQKLFVYILFIIFYFVESTLRPLSLWTRSTRLVPPEQRAALEVTVKYNVPCWNCSTNQTALKLPKISR